MSEFRERAFLVCRSPDGTLAAGQVVTGKRYRVGFPSHCPAAARPIAVVHSHPPDADYYPSPADFRQTKRRGLEFVCVVHRGKLRCYQP